MSHRRHLVVSAAIVAAATALAPCAAFASTPATTLHAHGIAGVTLSKSTKSAASAKASPSTPLRTFTSKSSSVVHRSQFAAKPAVTGTTIYVAGTPGLECTTATDYGTGTAANPFCSIQDAITVVKSGDVISVAPQGDFTYSGFSLSGVSNISIVGAAAGVDISEPYFDSPPGISLDDVSDVKISNLSVSGSSTSTVTVADSSGVTLDSDYVVGGGTAVVSIDGASSGVTVSRTTVAPGDWSETGTAISVAAGASNITLASNIIALYGANSISATGVKGLDVVGNTIQRACGSAVSVAGASTGVSIENNLFEDANPVTDLGLGNGGGWQASCTDNDLGWAPDVTVAAASAAGTTSTYNDFYSYGTDDTAPYSWNGAIYPTLSAFHAATGQGAHDLNDTVEADPIFDSPGLFGTPGYDSGKVDAVLQTGSAAIGSANTAAPGALSSDFFNNAPNGDRGAISFADNHMSAGLSISQTSALGVTAEATASSASRGIAIYSYAWGDGNTQTESGSAQYSYAKPGTYPVTLTITDPLGFTATTTSTITTAGNDYSPFGPTRLLDTRFGIGAPIAQIPAHSTFHLPIAGNDGIPANVTAVVLNITVTNPHGSGFITAYDDGDSEGVPTASNVNYVSGQTVPNLTIVPVGEDGDVALYNGGDSAGAVDLIVDVTGYFSPIASSGYTPLTPDRLVDTRYGTGSPKAQVPAGGSIVIPIPGNDGGLLPASDITAVALNVTATNPKGSGFLTAYPDDENTPNASNVNYSKGQTIANSVVVPIGSDGDIDITNSGDAAAGTDIVVDVTGYYSTASDSAYVPIYPERVLDTRFAPWTDGPLQNGSYDYIGFGLDENDVNLPSITAVVVNATVSETQGSGFLTVSPDPNTWQAYQNKDAYFPTPPNSSNLNWVKGETVPNLVQAGTGNNGIVDFWNLGDSGGDTALIVDYYGYYQND
jgi:hypothetical protein